MLPLSLSTDEEIQGKKQKQENIKVQMKMHQKEVRKCFPEW